MKFFILIFSLLSLQACLLNLGVGKTVAEQTKIAPLEKTKEAIDKTLEAALLVQLSSDVCLQLQLNDKDNGNHGVIKPRVENRVAILEGTIETIGQKREAERLASLVPEIRDVVNRLEIIGPRDATEVCEFVGFGLDDDEDDHAEEEDDSRDPIDPGLPGGGHPGIPPIIPPGGPGRIL
ncbi:hypothetical protein CL659_03345 [bacterium]|nr:hypothetical protein [bacterium]|tara:strand:+ start:157 stop:693 length:537 start_codon:yes stop_codon:yes gene_type:complete